MNPNETLRLENLSIKFPGPPETFALQDLSLSLSSGKTLAIVGESGSGKSMTALAIMGLLPKVAQWSGTINLADAKHPVKIQPESSQEIWGAIRGRRASMVFQDPMTALNPVMKIGHQVREAIRISHKVSRRKAAKLSLEWLVKVKLPEPEKLYHRYPHQLSGGQKQRVVIAMAMCCRPALLLADEPTTALDVTVQKEILLLMKTLQQELGMAMIFITHDLAVAADIADDILVLYQGKVMEVGAAAQILKTPQNAYTQALLACRPSADAKGKRLPVVGDFMEATSQQAAQVFPKNIISETPLLRVRELRVWFPTQRNLWGNPLRFFRAVENVSFDLHQGEVLGLVGESGCGKSTISRAIMGLQRPESGHIFFQGKDLAHCSSSDWQRLRKEVQMIFQDPYSSLNPRCSIEQLLIEPMLVNNIVPRRQLRAEAMRLLDLVQLPETSLQRYPHEFSGGQRQRIGIARALSLRPKLLLCDESVSALDISVQAQILNLLKELQAEFKLSYLFISHDLNVVHYLADQVLVMQQGAIVERGKAEEVLRHPKHPYTQKLIAAIP